jgi:hypothetical protein
MVDRYTEWADWTGWADEPAERRPRQGTGTDSAEGFLHFAKVRVAGSNPVVRSIVSPAQTIFSGLVERGLRLILVTPIKPLPNRVTTDFCSLSWYDGTWLVSRSTESSLFQVGGVVRPLRRVGSSPPAPGDERANLSCHSGICDVGERRSPDTRVIASAFLDLGPRIMRGNGCVFRPQQ